jgi:hypothetical protein
MAGLFDRLKSALRGLFRKPPAMIGTPPSARQIPADPEEHARRFANEYADFLERFVEGRMHALDISEEQIGFADRSRGLPWAVFHPNSTTGGVVIGRRIAVDSGVFNPELLYIPYRPRGGAIWEKSRLRDSIDAVIVHEATEGRVGTHEGAEALAAETDLPVSEGTRRILRAMARRGL